jgi:iron complex outermembrane recepter protein
VVGVQPERLDVSALGEEAFVPSTRIRSTAFFALQELASGAAGCSGAMPGVRVSVWAGAELGGAGPPLRSMTARQLA